MNILDGTSGTCAQFFDEKWLVKFLLSGTSRDRILQELLMLADEQECIAAAFGFFFIMETGNVLINCIKIIGGNTFEVQGVQKGAP